MSDPTGDLYAKALRLLAMREHSRHELARKLQSVDADPLSLDALLDGLEQSGYLDDQRYAEMLVRSSLARGHGPMKIAYALREKGVAPKLGSAALALADADWQALAAAQRCKKFGKAIPRDAKERARQSRFLAGRGFYLETINAVFHEKC